VRPADSVTPRLGIFQSGHPSIFKSQTGFWAEEFEAVCGLVAHVLVRNVRSTGLQKIREGRPTKLDVCNRLLSFILSVKQNKAMRYESSSWNWSRTSICDDLIWVSDATNEGMGY
jgi:hypothetical protein